MKALSPEVAQIKASVLKERQAKVDAVVNAEKANEVIVEYKAKEKVKKLTTEERLTRLERLNGIL